MRYLFAVLFMGLTLSTTVQSHAQSNMVVVELYTSQGCSSCPPADDLLAKLAKRDDVIPLALHVDYWDYIGWKDVFGNPAYTARQKAYAKASGHRTIYTPQMIIDGTENLVGYKPMKVADLIHENLQNAAPVSLSVERKGNKVQIQASLVQGPKQKMVIQLVRYLPLETIKITRGENKGRTIDYANIVTDWTEIGTWDGRKPVSMSAKAPGPEPVVIIVQAVGPGRILAATRLR